MENNKNETKRVSTSNLNKKIKSKNKKGKNGKIKFKDKHPKASKAIKIGILVFILLLIVSAGILVGAFIGIFGDELKIDESSLVIKHENSTLYDADGNERGTLSGGTKRKSISLSEMSEYLPKAYVAIEDERFYKHAGIDIGRTAYATITYILHGGKSSFGGSTITQQVIKNITQDKEKTAFAGVMRKVKEISKAIQVEHYLSKDQILELYLNLIFVGGDDINGVELGSVYYFDKSAKDLSIAECAYMAGINNSPNAYKPFEEYGGDEAKKTAMKDKINTRTKTVLGKMKELGDITNDQYDQAISEVDNGLQFKKGEAASVTTDVTYLEEAAIDQILDQIMSESDNEDMNRDTAEMLLYSGGYKIYTTQKSNIQETLENEISSDKYITKSTYTDKNKETGEKEKITQYSAPTMVIMDHTTGQVVAAATATGNSDERKTSTKLGYFNYPTSIKKQTGSSMKPISVIAPGLETGTINAATVYDDCPTNWGSYAPKEWYDGYKGLMNMRTAIEISANIPHVKALSNIGIDASVEFCKSVGLPDFTESGLSLALGGLEQGVSPAQMTAAYSAIANDGEYITPTYYIKVTDKDGNIVYEPKQEKTRVMSAENAYVEKNMLTQPVVGSSGTAKYCAIPGIETAAKTGTTNENYDRWLAGFTPYYTAVCWYGYVQNAEVHYSGNPAGKIWAAVMKSIHQDLDNAEFTRPDGVVEKSVCKISGKLATAACGGNVYTEVFSENNVPTEECEGHNAIRICVDSGALATQFCPNVRETTAYLPEHERDASWTSQHTVATAPETTCPLHQSGGATSYVTAEDEAGFRAATEADAMGLTGQAREDYINNAKNNARNNSQGSSQPSTPSTTPPSQPSQQPTSNTSKPSSGGSGASQGGSTSDSSQTGGGTSNSGNNGNSGSNNQQKPSGGGSGSNGSSEEKPGSGDSTPSQTPESNGDSV